MCSPAVIPMVMTGMQIAGGYEQAQAEKRAAQDKQSYYNFLADQNERQANTVLVRGEQTATSIAETSAIDQNMAERQSRVVEGAQKAAEGASGTAGSVSAEDIARDTNRTHEMDMNALRFDADSKIWATKTQASDQARSLRDQAASMRIAGSNARTAGDTAATGTLLGTATSVADNWYRYGQTSMGRSPGAVKVRPRPSGYAQAPDYGNA